MSTPAASPAFSKLQYDSLIEALRVDGQTWTIDRLEEARTCWHRDALTYDEVLDAFGNPELNERKADILIKALTYAGMY